jgi:hypothetical protein
MRRQDAGGTNSRPKFKNKIKATAAALKGGATKSKANAKVKT